MVQPLRLQSTVVTVEPLDLSWKGLTRIVRCLLAHPRVRMLAHIAFAGGEDASSMRFRSSRCTAARYAGSPAQRGTNGGYRAAPWGCQSGAERWRWHDAAFLLSGGGVVCGKYLSRQYHPTPCSQNRHSTDRVYAVADER